MNLSLRLLGMAKKWWIVSFIVFCTGCGAITRTVEGPKVLYASPEVAWSAIQHNDMADNTLKAIARIRIIQNDQQQFYLKGAVMAKKPQYLRFEALPLIGPPNFFLTINEKKIKVFLPDRASFYIGDATQTNLSVFFPLPLSPEAVVSLLMGTYPRVVAPPPYTLQGSATNDIYRLDLVRQGQMVMSFQIDPGHHRLVRYDAYGKTGRLVYQARFSHFTQAGTASIPMEIALTIHTHTGEPQTISITLSDIQVVREDDAEPYNLAQPQDTKLIPLQAAAE